MPTITIPGENIKLNIEAGISVGQALKDSGIYLSQPCGGFGSCGKCKIRVRSGELSPSQADYDFLSYDEIQVGIRLACRAYPINDISIELLSNKENIKAIGSGEAVKAIGSVKKTGSLGIAIDIGTTTLAAILINVDTKEILAEATGINHQIVYGSDVVSRIKAAGDGYGIRMQESIKSDITLLCMNLVSQSGVTKEAISQIAIAGNTTMIHLLVGYSCEGLGVYPFTPVNVDTITGTALEILGINMPSLVTILPGISTYVGGDIVSGLLSVGIDRSDELIALIDLGTNGEMAIGNKNRIVVTSAAAGPAFEGGNISCGMGSLPGAVCGVDIDDSKIALKTINNERAIGLCGTGVIELTGELLKNGIIDETGLMDETLGDNGYTFARGQSGENLYFTQKDVREIQMAKAAIRAGFETLLLKYGITLDELDKVYIAGGFGYYLDVKKAADIGLLPADILDKVEAVGNTSLKGAASYMLYEDSPARTDAIVHASEEISLAKDACFSDLYINSMMF